MLFTKCAGWKVYECNEKRLASQNEIKPYRVMIEVLIVLVGLVAGSLLVVQGCVMRQCFLAGQPRENAHFSHQILVTE